MPLYITQDDTVRTLRYTSTSVIDAMRGTPQFKTGRAVNYYLCEVVNWLDRRARNAIGELTAAAFDSDSLYVGDDAAKVANTFELFVNSKENFRDRAKEMQKRFGNALALSCGGVHYMAVYESLRQKVLLDSHVTRYILTGEVSAELKNRDFDKFAIAFAMLNGRLTAAEMEDLLTTGRIGHE